jgi:hypothetical protein
VAQSYDNLTVSVRKSPDGERYNYGVWLYGTFFIIGGFPATGFEDDLDEAAEAAGEPLELPPTSVMQ